MPDPKTQIQDLVGQGNLEEALKLAKQTALGGLTTLDTPVTLLCAEYEHHRQAVLNGLIDFKEEKISRQNIAFRLLSLFDESGKALVKTEEQTKPAAPKTVVLFLGANPFKKLALELEREVEEISKGLEHFGKRQAFDFRAKIHVTPTDLQRMLLDSELAPRFVHFAGNAVVNHPDYGSGVVFEDEQGEARTIGGDVLAMIFKQFPGVECVFLNTCDSGPSALAIGRHVPYAIGMNARVYDESAIIFAVAFYEAIADGNDVPFAFEFARTRLLTERYPEQASIPVLIVNGRCNDPVYVDGDSHLGSLTEARIMR